MGYNYNYYYYHSSIAKPTLVGNGRMVVIVVLIVPY